MRQYTFNNIELSRKEYEGFPDSEWRKDYFNEENGGYVVTHVHKKTDDFRRPGIIAEVNACFELAEQGKHILRLPENIPEIIDDIIIDGRVFRGLLKFKEGETVPRGYPDVYFDGKTWDFKTSTFNNEESLRQTIKDGRKADNIIFVTDGIDRTEKIRRAIAREEGRRRQDNSWKELPDVYCLCGTKLMEVWKKQ